MNKTTESKENFKEKKKNVAPNQKQRRKEYQILKEKQQVKKRKKKFDRGPQNEEGIIRTRKSRRRHEKK